MLPRAFQLKIKKNELATKTLKAYFHKSRRCRPVSNKIRLATSKRGVQGMLVSEIFFMTRMGSILRKLLSWLVMILGLFIGFLLLVRFGKIDPPFDDAPPSWRVLWMSLMGCTLLLAGVFLVGSITALRNRKQAGLIFLILMPVAVFGLSYLTAEYGLSRPDGSEGFEAPEIPAAIGLTVVFFLPVWTGLLAIRGRRRVRYLFALTLGLAGLVFRFSHWTKALLPSLAGWSPLFLLFGLFWLETSVRGWPPLLQPRERSLLGRAGVLVLTGMVVLCADLAVTLGLSALESSLFSPDCNGKPPMVRPESAYHAVFTARVVFVGRSRPERIFGNPELPQYGDSRRGEWGVGAIQERFWGVPAWSHFVLLTNFNYQKGTTYFVDGTRERGLLIRMLPIVSGRISCSRTKPVQDAAVDLRILHARALKTPSSQRSHVLTVDLAEQGEMPNIGISPGSCWWLEVIGSWRRIQPNRRANPRSRRRSGWG